MKKFERFVIYPMLFIALFFSFAGGDLQQTTAQQGAEEHIIAKRITVINDDYESIIQLGNNSSDGGIISVYDEDEKKVAIISSTINGIGGSINVFNKFEESVGTFGIAKNNSGALWVKNKSNDKIGVCTYEGYKYIKP
jgi:hypothetical protein